jgi:hypothetical protein
MSESVNKFEKRNPVRFLERILSQAEAMKIKRILRRWFDRSAKSLSAYPTVNCSKQSLFASPGAYS